MEEEAEESDKSSSDGFGLSASSSSSSEDERQRKADSDEEGQLVDMERFRLLREKTRLARKSRPRDDQKDAKLEAFPTFKKFLSEQPKPSYVPATAGLSTDNRDASFGQRKSEAGPSSSKRDEVAFDEDEVVEGMEITWTPGEDKPEPKERSDKKPKKEKKRKGVQTFGAGMEKGVAQETEAAIPESQRHGRERKRSRSDLRSASKNKFRAMK